MVQVLRDLLPQTRRPVSESLTRLLERLLLPDLRVQASSRVLVKEPAGWIHRPDGRNYRPRNVHLRPLRARDVQLLFGFVKEKDFKQTKTTWSELRILLDRQRRTRWFRPS